jgi:hypothetical protein
VTQVPIEHVLFHVRDTLAADSRVGELGLDVEVVAGTVVVSGPISTRARREGVGEVVREVLRSYGSDLAVRNDTYVTETSAPDREPEQL